MRIEIGEANADDLPGIVNLNNALFQEDAGQRDPFMNLNWPQEEGTDYFMNHVNKENSLVLVAATNEATIGYLVGYLRGHSTLRPVKMAELESMYVATPYRSAGIGQRLVNQFLDWASSQGAQRVSVTAYAANERAISFYQRLGFVPKNVSLELGL